ncbi:hypothetical protein [Oceanobacillus sp. J11TS1]|uniref:hypothetical protein n=1 Tax=Oceanobacillus sp. J11TS1 TaxID=2807191 RepID=UPI001AFE008F|nr:hypothetical protein [Oceanobacillus sp. J11TS1]GIO22494.1 hypothetical protein J11TS1_10750 [Oceanobacillus sp. J11TS1]
MKVTNDGENIKIEASFIEASEILNVLNKYWIVNNDEKIQKLAYQLSNPKVILK